MTTFICTRTSSYSSKKPHPEAIQGPDGEWRIDVPSLDYLLALLENDNIVLSTDEGTLTLEFYDYYRE